MCWLLHSSRACACARNGGLVVEQRDDRIGKARELTDRANRLFRRVGVNYIESYASGDLCLAVRSALPQESDYGFLIYAKGRRVQGREVVLGASGCLNGHGFRNDFDIYKPTMLAHDVELMERPKGFIPSLIRFQRFNDRALPVGEPLYQFACPIEK
jgi:hypothetical protein